MKTRILGSRALHELFEGLCKTNLGCFGPSAALPKNDRIKPCGTLLPYKTGKWWAYCRTVPKPYDQLPKSKGSKTVRNPLNPKP